MITRKRSLAFSAVAYDLAILMCAFFIAAIVAQSYARLLARSNMFFLLAAEFVVWYFTANSVGLYEDIGARSYATQAARLLKAVLIQIAAAVFFIFTIKEDLFTRNFILLYGGLLFLFVTIRSIAFRKILKYLSRHNKLTDQLLVIGSSLTAEHFIDVVRSNPAFNYGKIVMLGAEKSAHPAYAGTLEALEQTIKANHFDVAIIALERSDNQQLQAIIRICNKYALHTFIIPDYFKFLSKKFDMALIGNLPILSLRREPLEEIHWRIVKRAFDLILSVAIIALITTWLFPVLMLLHKLTSRGPVFFVQDRVGKNHKSFRCYKFRSMKHYPEPQTFMPVAENDERITSFGRFLRKSNLDETPQIFNVLKGDMSLVGPRPHAVSYDEVYKDFIEELRLRNLVKPGITGWAQVHGLRGDVADPEANRTRIKKRIEYDVWYIENWSFSLDLQIIFMTLWHMIKGDTKGI